MIIFVMNDIPSMPERKNDSNFPENCVMVLPRMSLKKSSIRSVVVKLNGAR